MTIRPEALAETEHHPFAGGTVDLLGAAHAVTGAMTRVELGANSILVDCGVAQGDEARRWRFPDRALDVDAVILTHGHNDHVGSLPVLLDRGYNGHIYGTRSTLDLADIVIRDGLHLQGASKREQDNFSRRLRELAHPVRYDKETWHARGPIRFTLHEAGHILGSSSVDLCNDKNRVIVSGDLGRPNSPILRDPNRIWTQTMPVDVAVVESTYGDKNHAQGHDDIEVTLERIIHQALRDGGHILVPAFAIGRTQLLIYHLNTLIESRRIPDIAVAIDTPMGLRVTELYSQARHLYDRDAIAKLEAGDDPLNFERLFAVNKQTESVQLRDAIEPMLIIAGSGMCTGGRIVGHLQELLPRPETCVVFIGYQAAGTPGNQIQHARKGDSIWLGGQNVRLAATIETISGLSAHADRNELADWICALPETRRIALHHGEPQAQHAFSNWLNTQG
jgi:metallo-beta-lactamase family protein